MLKQSVLQLRHSKYFVIDNFITQEDLIDINSEISSLMSSQSFKQAGAGVDGIVSLNSRRDLIYWLGDNKTSRLQEMLICKMKNLTEVLNENLYLGLWSQEFHYSIYPIGGYYRKHVDRFQNTSSRVISIILYLNDTWEVSNGGELVLHLPLEEKILPIGGRLVCFLSEDLTHEVLPCSKERRSLTGWLKTRNA